MTKNGGWRRILVARRSIAASTLPSRTLDVQSSTSTDAFLPACCLTRCVRSMPADRCQGQALKRQGRVAFMPPPRTLSPLLLFVALLASLSLSFSVPTSS
jgi:hypothetical protein